MKLNPWSGAALAPDTPAPSRRRFLLRAATLAVAGTGAAHLSGFARTHNSTPVSALTINSVFPAPSGPGKFVGTLAQQLVETSPATQFSIRQISPADIIDLAGTEGQLFVLSNNDVVTPGFGQKSPDTEAALRLRPVAPLLVNPFFVVIGRQSPWQSLEQLIAHAQANPGAVRYGSWGSKSLGRIYGAKLAKATGSQMIHMAYPNLGALYQAVEKGEVDWALGTGIGPAAAATTSGAIRPLAIADSARDTTYDVPTLEESLGLKDLHFRAWLGLFADTRSSPSNLSDIQAMVERATSATLRSAYPGVPPANQLTPFALQTLVRHERFIQHL